MRDLRVAAAVLALAAFGAAPASGQTPDAWEPPRMPDGRPDLQGVWVNNVATPLQRLPAMADRSHLSEEEVAALEERAERIFANGRSAFTTPEGAFRAALQDVETYNGESTSSSIGMIDITFTDRTSLIVDPPDGRIPEQTELAQARETAVDEGWTYKAGPEDLNNIHRCITTGVPRLGGNFGSGPYTFYQIVQTPTHLAFINEAFHDTRLIPLDDRPHLPEQIRQWNGDSRGHWDGDTLVVETKNFSPKSYFRGSTDGLHLVERFTRSGPDTLTYRVTLSDPETWEEPWTVEVPLQRREQAIYEFACHEGNHSIEGMLKTARIEEDRP